MHNFFPSKSFRTKSQSNPLRCVKESRMILHASLLLFLYFQLDAFGLKSAADKSWRIYSTNSCELLHFPSSSPARKAAVFVPCDGLGAPFGASHSCTSAPANYFSCWIAWLFFPPAGSCSQQSAFIVVLKPSYVFPVFLFIYVMLNVYCFNVWCFVFNADV